jgi:hypothetical protein
VLLLVLCDQAPSLLTYHIAKGLQNTACTGKYATNSAQKRKSGKRTRQYLTFGLIFSMFLGETFALGALDRA